MTGQMKIYTLKKKWIQTLVHQQNKNIFDINCQNTV